MGGAAYQTIDSNGCSNIASRRPGIRTRLLPWLFLDLETVLATKLYLFLPHPFHEMTNPRLETPIYTFMSDPR